MGGGTKTPGGGGGGSGRHRAPLEVIVALWGNAAQWHWATLTYSACTTHIGSSPFLVLLHEMAWMLEYVYKQQAAISAAAISAFSIWVLIAKKKKKEGRCEFLESG